MSSFLCSPHIWIRVDGGKTSATFNCISTRLVSILQCWDLWHIYLSSAEPCKYAGTVWYICPLRLPNIASGGAGLSSGYWHSQRFSQRLAVTKSKILVPAGSTPAYASASAHCRSPPYHVRNCDVRGLGGLFSPVHYQGLQPRWVRCYPLFK